MIQGHKREPLLLFLGDVILLYASLWFMLFVRYSTFPTPNDWDIHFIPFSILFIFWMFAFFVAGLYEGHTTLLKSRLPGIIMRVQASNVIIAVLFFYFIPIFQIAPKTNLFIYLIISSALLLIWRIYGHALLAVGRREKAILIGSGPEMRELIEEVNSNSRYDLVFVSTLDLDEVDGIDFEEDILNRVYSEGVRVIVADIRNEKVAPLLPRLYNLIFSNIRFVDMYRIYEDIFDRVPLSLVHYNWFLENISTSPHAMYDILKRSMDVAVSFTLGLISLVLYPFIAIAILLDDGGDIFITQERVGQGGKTVKIVKFRTMSGNDCGQAQKVTENHITRVGAFLRKTRLDELPQLWNVLRGDLSLIGPRPEMPVHVKIYNEQIRYYNVRHLIKPGLSGWAQIYQNDPPKRVTDNFSTKNKLSYDFFYVKNRSFFLDIKIGLKTMKTLLSQSGK